MPRFGGWHLFPEVQPGQAFTHDFPAGYAAHWIRVAVDRDCTATAQLAYE